MDHYTANADKTRLNAHQIRRSILEIRFTHPKPVAHPESFNTDPRVLRRSVRG